MNRKMWQRIVSVIAMCSLLLAQLPSFTVQALAVTQSEFEAKVAELRQQYPSGSQYGGTYGGTGSQCWAFAREMGDLVFGSSPLYDWEKSYDYSEVKAGDVVQFGDHETGHSIFVTAVSGDTITYADSNSREAAITYGYGNVSGMDVIMWDHTASISDWCLWGNSSTYGFSYLLKSPDKTSDDTEAPVISNIRIEDVSSEGYTISCTVTDNVGVERVEFPTWSDANEQDDMIWERGTQDGDTYSYRVNVDEHNGETGMYHTHIYAYDFAGNQSLVNNVGWIWVCDLEDLGEEFYAQIMNTDQGRMLTNDDTNVTLRTDEDGDDQWWHFVQLEDGYYVIYSEQDQKALSVEYSDDSVPNVYVDTYTGSEDQQWKIMWSEDEGNYYFQVKSSNYALDVYNNSEEEGANLDLFDVSWASQQQFCLIFSYAYIDEEPQDVVAKLGDTIELTVKVSGRGVFYQWQSRKIGEDWTDIEEFTTDTLVTEATEEWNGTLVRCVVTDLQGVELYTDTVLCSVEAADDTSDSDYDDTDANASDKVEELPSIVVDKQPEDVQANAGNTVNMSVEATGEKLTYQWQSRKAGADWNNMSECTSSNIELKLTEDMDGMLVRCVITDDNDYVEYTNNIICIVKTVDDGSDNIEIGNDNNDDSSNNADDTDELPSIVVDKQPKDVQANVGETVNVSVEATGEKLTYQWQSRKAGADWNNMSECTSSNIELKLTEDMNGMLVRCVITDDKDYVEYTNNIICIVKTVDDGSDNIEIGNDNNADSSNDVDDTDVQHSIVIEKEPEDVVVDEGDTIKLSVKATGEKLSYQWQYRNIKGKWNDWEGYATSAIEVTATSELDGILVRCVITSDDGPVETTEGAWISVETDTQQSSSEILLGDVNGDGKVDMKDVVLLRRYIAGWDVKINLTASDVNQDNSIDTKDVVIPSREIAES